MNQQNDRPGTPATSQLPSDPHVVKGNPHGVKTIKAIQASRLQTQLILGFFFFIVQVSITLPFGSSFVVPVFFHWFLFKFCVSWF
jgi:hypothetical protein